MEIFLFQLKTVKKINKNHQPSLDMNRCAPETNYISLKFKVRRFVHVFLSPVHLFQVPEENSKQLKR